MQPSSPSLSSSPAAHMAAHSSATAPNWLEQLYEELPEAIKERTASVWEGYIEQRVDETSDLFVLVCGRPGTAKSSLINAIVGHEDLLATSGSTQTVVMPGPCE